MRQLSGLFKKIRNIIPSSLKPEQKKQTGDFTRKRCLTLPRLITCILGLVAGGKTEGADIELAVLFKMARRSKLWPEAKAPGRSALSRAREKVPWQAFEEMQERAASLAYEVWPEREGDRWHGMNVLAVDGSKFNLPATEKIRQEFDPESGLQTPGKGHYPQAMVSTLYDVLRGFPVARTVMPYCTCERKEALKLLPSSPKNSLILFDRGYPAYWFLHRMMLDFSSHFLMRCPTSATFSALTNFLKGSQNEAVIQIAPTESYTARQRKSLPTLTLRAIRARTPEGKDVALLTNLLDSESISAGEITALYFKRWEVEVYYREEKGVQDLERFHSRTPHGLRQEYFAVMVLTVISRTMAALSEEGEGLPAGRGQRKHAVIALARDAALLTPTRPRQALALFQELLGEMARIKYYAPKTARPSVPRVCKKSRPKFPKPKAAPA